VTRPGNLYGTTEVGGSDTGVVYKLDPSGNETVYDLSVGRYPSQVFAADREAFRRSSVTSAYFRSRRIFGCNQGGGFGLGSTCSAFSQAGVTISVTPTPLPYSPLPY
jgi:uncharacterized repeat protein (TIGR03803 family)